MQAKASQGVANAHRAAHATPLPPHLAQFHAGPGQPLPPVVQRKMEQLFGRTFGDVRVHVAPHAAAMGAHAFTSGSHIYFAPGKANFDTLEGQRLLAHELGHVLQQRAGRVINPHAHPAVIHDHALEAEAARMAGRVVPDVPRRAAASHPVQRKSTRVVQRITLQDAKKHLTNTEFQLFVQWLKNHSPGVGPNALKETEDLAMALMVNPVPTIDAMREILKLYDRQLKGEKLHDNTYEAQVVDELHGHLTKSAILAQYASGIRKQDVASAVTFLDETSFASAHYKHLASENSHITSSPDKEWLFKISAARKITQTLAFEHNGTIFLRKGDAAIQIAVHELLHKLSANNIGTILGPVLNEGLTETITRLVCTERQLPITEDVYIHQRDTVRQILAVYNIDQNGMLDIYFNNPQSLRNRINTTLGNGANTFITNKDAAQATAVYVREREAECQRQVLAGTLLETTKGRYAVIPPALGKGNKTLATRVTDAITSYNNATKFKQSSETVAAITVLNQVSGTHHQLYAAVRWYLRHNIQRPPTVQVGSTLNQGSRFDGLLSQAYNAWT